jgi:hypothetical protein
LPPTSNEIPSFFFLLSSNDVDDFSFISFFKPSSTFGFSIDSSIFGFWIDPSFFGFWIDPSIFDFGLDLSIEGRIWTLLLSASRTRTFNSPDSFGLSIDGFLISRLPPNLNEILSFFFYFSSDEDEDDLSFLSFFKPSSTFGFSSNSSNFGFSIDRSTFESF